MAAVLSGDRKLSPWVIVGAAVCLTFLLGLAAGSMLETYDANIGFAAEADRIAEVLGVRPGMSVGDVRAGTGRWSVDLARRVGDDGMIYATPGPNPPSDIYQTVADAGVENVNVILRTPGPSPRLPIGCCDAILLRFVYRSFGDRPLIAHNIALNLRPGGTLAVIDWHAGTPGRNAVAKEVAIEEITAAGFELQETIDEWAPHVYCLVFRRTGEPAAPGALSPLGSGKSPA
jgi:ubiE/COQ5 methyltransferase family